MKPIPPIHPHDRARRLLFQHPELIEDLLRRHVAEPWVDQLDLSTLERETKVTLSDDLQERRADTVWKVRFHDGPSVARAPTDVYLLILLEFQSSPDRYMPLRLLIYACRLWENRIRHQQGRHDTLPPIFPIVLYNGRRAWDGPWSLSELIAPVPAPLADYQPAVRCFPIDERDLPLGLDAGRDLVAAVAALDRGETAEEIERIVGRLVSWLHDDGQKSLRQAFAAWIRGVLSTAQSRHGAKDIRNVDDLLELKSMLHETVREWPRQWKAEGRQEGRLEGRQEGRLEGRQEGRLEGRQEGERDLLIRLLERRFGVLDSTARARLQAADRDRLGAWGTRLLDAETLDDVWGEDS